MQRRTSPLGPMTVVPHLPSSVRQWVGDSRGRWDGDTLVVETTNFLQGNYGMTNLLNAARSVEKVSPPPSSK